MVITMPEHRIVSLLASATEIVAALGYQSSLVGRSHECDFPAGVENLPICSQPRIDVSGSSSEIDQAVKQALTSGLSIYEVLTDELERLQPTIVITQTQCDVCAITLSDVESALRDLTGSRPELVALQPMQLSDVWQDVRSVAQAIGDIAAGEKLVASLKSRLEKVRCDADAQTDGSKPTVVCIEWMEPLMTAGNWVPELVEIAGGTPLLCEAGKHSPWLEWDQLIAADPDAIFVMPCGFSSERIRQELHLLESHDRWLELKAPQKGNVFVVDGHQFFNRPGPRLVESAEILAKHLHER
jgi:iron complex transport system substrate-binding protein